MHIACSAVAHAHAKKTPVPPAHTFNPESLPDFVLKPQIPSFK